jgi:protein involved in polysaccharide export with SLBB domain
MRTVSPASTPPLTSRCLSALSASAAVLIFFAAGCAADRNLVDNNLKRDPPTELEVLDVAEHYRVACPDVLEIEVKGRREFDGNYTVEPDGRINLGRYGRLRVEGRFLSDVGGLLADEIGARPQDVRVRVAEFRSQHVVIFGGVVGWQRTVRYRGQETVLELLQRVGGITPGAAPEHVYVVRAHLGAEQRPEVFHVDLNAIVMKKDENTNLRILPFDQVYVGETRQARIERLIPPWLRPAYQKLWDLLPAAAGPTDETSFLSRWISGAGTGAGPPPAPNPGKVN